MELRNGFVSCPTCGSQVKQKNLDKHRQKVHNTSASQNASALLREQAQKKAIEDLRKVLKIKENKKIVKCPRCLKEMEQDYLKHHIYVIHAIDYRSREEVTMEELLFGSGTIISKLPWIILEPGENSFERIMQFFRELQAVNYHIEYDLQRLRDVYSLAPTEIYIGLHEFNGYIVFYFSGLHKAVLECPVTGNAVYIIQGDWKKLSRLSKTELVNYHSEEVVRVIHTGNWFGRLRQSLF
jgi:endogenous inhibitor of DNA gyrase (YacG/DUF329 family)